MRAIFEYSWGLLESSQQDCLKGLTVFRGGFTIEAVKTIINANQREILDLLDASLVQEINEKLFDLQPLVKQYAIEKASSTDKKQHLIQEKHCNYYLSIVSEQKESIRSEEQEESIKKIEGALENIHAAWNWSIDNSTDSASQIAATEVLRRFFVQKGRLIEGVNFFEETLLNSSSNIHFESIIAHVKVNLGCIKLFTDLPTASQLSKDSISSLKAQKDFKAIMVPLSTLGSCEATKGNYLTAKNYFTTCVKIARHYSDIDEATYLTNLSVVEELLTNQTSNAIRFFEEGLQLASNLSSNQIKTFMLSNLGNAYYKLGSYDKALPFQQQALADAILNGHKDLETVVNLEIGKTLLASRDLDGACDFFKRSFQLSLEGQHTQNSLKALVHWVRYLIVLNNIKKGLSILFYIDSHSAKTQEDEEIVTRTIKVLDKQVTSEVKDQAKSEAKQIELEPLLESILNEPTYMPPPRTIDSTELTATL